MSTTSLRQHSSAERTTLLMTLTTGHLVNDFYLLVLPFLIPTFIASFNLSYFQAGLLALATTVLSGMLQPVFGFLADKYALRKKLLIAGFLAFGLGLMLMGLAPTYTVILIACFIYGLGMATFHPQSTNFLTTTFASTKGRVMGIHGIGGSIGNFLAPTLVALLVTFIGWRSGVFVLIAPAILIVALLSFVLKERPKAPVESFWQGISKKLIILALTYSLVLMLYQGFLTFLPTYLVEQGSTISQAGGISSLMLLVGFLSQPCGGYLYDKVGGKFVLIMGAMGAGGALWLFTLSQSILFIILVGAFVSALFPVALTMSSEISTGNRVGMSVGLVFGISSTLSAFTSALTGYAADILGLNLAFQFLVALPLFAIGLALFLPQNRIKLSFFCR
jgi:FSR family fosmidomycin resistance protein-like MFS transporter